MKLIIADFEIDAARKELIDSIDELYEIATDFVEMMNLLRQRGYVSEAMDSAIVSRIAVVNAATSALMDAKEPIAVGADNLVKTIDSINHL